MFLAFSSAGAASVARAIKGNIKLRVNICLKWSCVTCHAHPVSQKQANFRRFPSFSRISLLPITLLPAVYKTLVYKVFISLYLKEIIKIFRSGFFTLFVGDRAVAKSLLYRIQRPSEESRPRNLKRLLKLGCYRQIRKEE